MINFENSTSKLNETVGKIRERIQEARSKILDITNIDENEVMEKLEEAGSLIELNDLTELRLALQEFGFAEEQIRKILSHENAHANKAESLGANLWRYIIFLGMKNGEEMALPAAKPSHPVGWSEKKSNEVRKATILAPLEYEDSLSESDRRYLKLFD